MDQIELLCVEDRFRIANRGLVLIPHFSVPESGWKNRKEAVRIETPEGGSLEATASVEVTHFNLVDPDATIDQKWRVVVRLLELTKEMVPDGSRVFASRELCHALVSDNGA